MTTPATTLSASDINIENGYAAAQTLSFDDAAVRLLAGAPGSGTEISMALLRGKYRIFNLSASAPIQNLNIYNTSIAAGWNGASALTYTIPAGIYIWSDSTTLPALTTGGAFPGGLTIVNNGYIMGKGGKGGVSPGTGNAGGPAINLTNPAIIDNTNPAAYIGGGGGGGDGSAKPTNYNGAGGGGAGGGDGGTSTWYPGLPAISGSGGAGGTIGNAGANGPKSPNLSNIDNYSGYEAKGGGAGGGGGQSFNDGFGTKPWSYFIHGAGGGRIFPGTGGGGGKTAWTYATWLAGNGGASNAAGAAGSISPAFAASSRYNGGGGGGWGASGGASATAGGAGGKAVALNSNTVTWTASNTTRVYGAIG